MSDNILNQTKLYALQGKLIGKISEQLDVNNKLEANTAFLHELNSLLHTVSDAITMRTQLNKQ